MQSFRFGDREVPGKDKLSMAENLFCDQSSCGEPAYAFGFTQGSSDKVKVCRKHVPMLLEKKLTIFDITGYRFIQTRKDVALYEHRRDLMQRGLGNLTILETVCSNDLMVAGNCLVESCAETFAHMLDCYKTMWEQTQQRYLHTKQHLDDLRESLEKWVRDKAFELNPADEALCVTAPDSLFSIDIRDCRPALSQALFAHFALLPRQDEPAPVFPVVRQPDPPQAPEPPAQEPSRPVPPVQEPSRPVPPVQEPSRPVPPHAPASSKSKKANVRKAVERCLKRTEEAWQRGDFETAIADLRKERSALERSDRVDLLLKLSNAIALSHYQMANLREAANESEAALRAWDECPHTLLLQETLWLLTNVLIWLGVTQKYGMLKEWQSKLVTDSPSSKCLQLYLRARWCWEEGNNTEAIRLYHQGLQMNLFPNTYITADAQHFLGLRYDYDNRWKQALDHYMPAALFFSERFPQSYDFAITFNLAGACYMGLGSPQKAEELMLKGHRLFAARFAHTVDFALCLRNLGQVYQHMGWKQQSEEKFEEARILFREVGEPGEAENVGKCAIC